MRRYIVGGFVRDTLLQRQPSDKDWVVIGETPESMLAFGFKQVGADFPVFLHPETGEEHALARTERKSRPGYRGFEVSASPEVTLEQDLERRDLTINAMAMDENGEIIDPFGGQRDLEIRCLRHVSSAFAEDPVRILRLARFSAKLPDFTVHHSTWELMRNMVASGEVDALVPERVWLETERALKASAPWNFFDVLSYCGALSRIMPEIARLSGVPQPEVHHPEIDTWEHIRLTLRQLQLLEGTPIEMFAALTHDLGKGVTPREKWPRHIDHEKTGLVELERLCARLRVPNAYFTLAQKVMRYHTQCHGVSELRPGTIVDLLNQLNAFSTDSSNALESFIRVCTADARGRLGRESAEYQQAFILRGCFEVARRFSAADVIKQRGEQLKGSAFGNALHQGRCTQVRQFLRSVKALPTSSIIDSESHN
jgi:tRNA nucleotidyltransferase (CCA-adding enzyme)